MPIGLVCLAYSLLMARQADISKTRPDEPKPIRIAMAGDSTMANYKSPPAAKGLTGWGMVFGEFFKDRVEIINLAASGRSTLSFRQQGFWKRALDAKPNYVFIQFGHNDQKNPALDAEGGFQTQLLDYIHEAREAGIAPVLVTPVARRTFNSEGKLETRLGPWADAMKRVSREKNLPLIDLHAKSMALYSKLGPKESAFITISPTDFTHFSERGAREIARLVTEEIPSSVPALKPWLK